MGSRLLYMLPALVVALVALILAVVGLSRNPASSLAVAPDDKARVAQEQQAPAFRYWVVTESLNIGDELTEDSLAVVSSPAPIANVLTADEDVVGKELRQFARPGELLSRNHLEPGGTLPGTLPAGYRALAVAVDDVVMAGGLVTPGDLVDVVVAFRKGDGERDNPAAMVLLSNVQVLAVKGAMAEAQSGQDREQQRRNNTVVLAVPSDKMPAVLLAEEEGALRLAVVASKDKSLAAGGSGKPVYYRDLFPGKSAPVRKSAPGQRVEVYEGSDSRSTYVR